MASRTQSMRQGCASPVLHLEMAAPLTRQSSAINPQGPPPRLTGARRRTSRSGDAGPRQACQGVGDHGAHRAIADPSPGPGFAPDRGAGVTSGVNPGSARMAGPMVGQDAWLACSPAGSNTGA